MPQSSQSRFDAQRAAVPSARPGGSHEPRFLDQVANACRVKHLAYRTEQSYVSWVKRFILFHNKRHPQEMGPIEVRAFLTHLAVNRTVSASTRNQALNANGKLLVQGAISPSTEAARQVIDLARSGFRCQASVGVTPVEYDRVRAGETVEVEGTNVSGTV